MPEDSHPAAALITAPDGRQIGARFFDPAGVARGAVLIVPAMGVAQDYYLPCAEWLAARGYCVATFDYRGIGYSRPARLRGFAANVLDWARLDCSVMIEAVTARQPGLPLYWIGHSLGGQILAFVPNRERIAKAVTVASGSGYWRENAPHLKRYVLWLWFVAVPAGVALCGYFPGKRLRKVGDLPKGVIEQWRRWCLDADYAAGAEGPWARAAYRAVRTPIVSLSFTDDEFMSARSIESLHRLYEQAPRTMKRIAPADAGVRRIGHFGFFRAGFSNSLWPDFLVSELT